VSETEPSAAASKDSVAATKASEAPEKKSAETKKPVGAAKEKEPVAEKAVSKEEAVSEKEISAEKAGKEAAPEKTVPPEKAEEKAAKEPVAKETAKAEKKEAEKPAEKETKTAGEALTEAPAGTETAAAGTGPVIDFDLEEEVAAGEETEATSEKTEESFNPFSALFEKEKVASTGGSDQGGQRDRKFLTPLERIGLGQLQLKGIIMAESGNRAIVTDASGKGYVVTKGTYIGLNSGKVKRIESDRVVVVEKIGSRESKTVLKLQKPAGE